MAQPKRKKWSRGAWWGWLLICLTLGIAAAYQWWPPHWAPPLAERWGDEWPWPEYAYLWIGAGGGLAIWFLMLIARAAIRRRSRPRPAPEPGQAAGTETVAVPAKARRATPESPAEAEPDPCQQALQALRSRDPTQRRQAVRTLGDLGDERSIPPLLAALETAQAEEQWAIAEALYTIGRALNTSVSQERRRRERR